MIGADWKLVTIFDDIYRHNRWDGRESLSGPGSGPSATQAIAEELPALVSRLGVKSVLNVGCGDDYWTPELPRYIGLDVSGEAIRHAIRNHPGRHYLSLNPAWYLSNVQHGGFDLVLLRDVIQHLPLDEGASLLTAIGESSGARWLLASTFVGGLNIDVPPGAAYSPDLTADPFSLSEPDELIFDGWGYDDAQAVRDPRKHLGLWRLR
jgi:SAM-dependent methyltransferase